MNRLIADTWVRDGFRNELWTERLIDSYIIHDKLID